MEEPPGQSNFYVFCSLFFDKDCDRSEEELNNALVAAFPTLLDHPHRRPRAVVSDFLLSRMFDYLLGYGVSQLNNFSIRMIFLGIGYVFFFPLINVMAIHSGLTQTVYQMGYKGNLDPIYPPNADSKPLDIIAWQVYHAVLSIGNFSLDQFVYG